MVCVVNSFVYIHTALPSSTNKSISMACASNAVSLKQSKLGTLQDATDMLRLRYIREFGCDEVEGTVKYINLALVKNEKVTRVDKSLEEFTKLTLQGQVDELLHKKEQLNNLWDIFHYQDKLCPRLILIVGAPGE